MVKRKRITKIKPNFKHIPLVNIPLGYEVKDRITGFKGLAISRTVFFNGCIQYQVKPKIDKQNKVLDASLVDCQQLEVIGQGIAPKKPMENKPPVGGDMPDAPKLELQNVL